MSDWQKEEKIKREKKKKHRQTDMNVERNKLEKKQTILAQRKTSQQDR